MNFPDFLHCTIIGVIKYFWIATWILFSPVISGLLINYWISWLKIIFISYPLPLVRISELISCRFNPPVLIYLTQSSSAPWLVFLIGILLCLDVSSNLKRTKSKLPIFPLKLSPFSVILTIPVSHYSPSLLTYYFLFLFCTWKSCLNFATSSSKTSFSVYPYS